MPQIQVLDAHVSELIAAGEVVERPASVVKELVENAIDAQSRAVTVAIERGGMASIRVSDDGCGISASDLPTAFLRHATSKVRSVGDLAQIGTLGFRGEALAAICAVSRVEIRTREKGASTGSFLRVEGGEIGVAEEIGTPEGTTITVRDLFYNTPARLKFMRKDSAETAAIHGLMQRLSLSRPDIAFRFDKDGATDLRTPGDGQLLSAIYAAYGREFARSLLPVDGRGGDVALSGYVTAPLYGRGSRAMQMFFINGRYIKSQLLTAALEEAYKNQSLKGKFPGCVLSLTLPAHMVDVNVHPAKTEVKFSSERDLFRTVYHTVLDNLNESGGPTRLPSAELGKDNASENRNAYHSSYSNGYHNAENNVSEGGFYRTMDAQTYRETFAGTPDNHVTIRERKSDANANRTTVNRFSDVGDFAPSDAEAVPKARSAVSDSLADVSNIPDTFSGVSDKSSNVSDTFSAISDAPRNPADAQQSLLPDAQTFVPWRMLGELFATYIVCESASGEMYLVDKHAAHERVNFDRLKASEAPPMRQTLLQPVAVELSREDAALLLDNAETLGELGFLCEDFGGATLLVREIPSDMAPEEIGATLEELASDLRSGRSPDERREAVLRTMACKLSIRGGDDNSPKELRVLLDKVQRGEIRYCPHGRPVAVKMTKAEIEKLFKR